ncbi:MAG: pitrilysin family protein [Candidatus Saccharibacteria bacterium]
MPLKHTVEEIVIGNGIKGLIIDVPDSTVVSYDINFRAGYDYADPSIQQVAHLLEHLSFGANDNYSTAEEFSQEFSKNGATISATTSNRSMSYSSLSALMELGRIMDLFKLAITHPQYKQKLFDAERGNVREELVAQANNHSRVLFQQIQRAMGDTCLIDSEKIETINKVELSDIQNFYTKTHTLNNMRFVIAGNISESKEMIIDKLNNWDLTVGERFPVKQVSVKSSPIVHLYRPDLSNLTFEITILLPRQLSTTELVAMGGLNHILTGTFHSRIFGKARSQGICYHVSSNYDTDVSNVSSWEIYGRVGLENAESLFKLIIEQLQKVIDNDITNEELDSAKQYALGRYQMRGQTVGSVVGWYAEDYFNREVIEMMDLSPESIKSTTLQDMVVLAKEFIEKGEWTLGGIGNISQEQLQSYYDLLLNLLKKVK